LSQLPALHGLDDAARRRVGDLLQGRPIQSSVPAPLVAKPERRQDVQFSRFRAAVVDVTWISRSSADALAYSTNTSK
jgi:hypothetical protein